MVVVTSLSATIASHAGITSYANSATANSGSTALTAPSTRYGTFDLFDHRSAYGQGVFPEPFLVDESDLETTRFALIGSTRRLFIPGVILLK